MLKEWEKTKTVTTDNLDDDKIYAAYAKEEGHIILITLISRVYRTVWLFPEQLQNHRYENESLIGIIEYMLSDGYEIFQFEDEMDFTEWVRGVYSSF